MALAAAPSATAAKNRNTFPILGISGLVMSRLATSAPTMPSRELATTYGAYQGRAKEPIRAPSITISTAVCTPRTQIQLRRGENQSAVTSKPAEGQKNVRCWGLAPRSKPSSIRTAYSRPKTARKPTRRPNPTRMMSQTSADLRSPVGAAVVVTVETSLLSEPFLDQRCDIQKAGVWGLCTH